MTEPTSTTAPSAPPRPGLSRARRVAGPLAVGCGLLLFWQLAVIYYAIPHYVLPRPTVILTALHEDWRTLFLSLWSTLQTTFLALFFAVTLGVALAVLFTQWQWLERSILPYVIVLQVTPVVAIAPLIIIWTGDINVSLLICAWLVAFFPILSNTMLGLNSADHNLLDLFDVYGASRWQKLVLLRLPSSMPYFLGGVRISGGLALIGAVVAEFVAGTGGQGSGLAFRILESGYQLRIPRMFAALILISIAGIAIYLLTSWIAWLLLHKWHESALKREL